MATLFEASNHLLIHADYHNPARHSHRAAHIILSTGGKMHVVSDEADFLCHGILIPAGTPHMIDTFGKAALVFLFDCSSDIARQIQSMNSISEKSAKAIVAAYDDLEYAYSADNYWRFLETVLLQLGFTDTFFRVQDERMITAMQYIHSKACERLTCKEVADTVHLSESRFSHLFKEEVGMPFVSYLIYQRMMHVYTQILKGKSITEAALEAGFSSSAHFADVNRRVFGLSASTFTHNLVFQKVQ